MPRIRHGRAGRSGSDVILKCFSGLEHFRTKSCLSVRFQSQFGTFYGQRSPKIVLTQRAMMQMDCDRHTQHHVTEKESRTKMLTGESRTRSEIEHEWTPKASQMHEPMRIGRPGNMNGQRFLILTKSCAQIVTWFVPGLACSSTNSRITHDRGV